MQQNIEDRSLGELFRELSHETLSLVRQEVEFAKTEMVQKADRTGRDVVFLASGGVIAFGGFLCILAAIVVALEKVMPLWGAALVVGVVVGGIGFVLIQAGLKRLKKEDLVPVQTKEHLKEDSQWLKNQMM